MIDEALLHELADLGGPTLVRPLPEIAARARVLRRRRRAGGLTAAALVAGLSVSVVLSSTDHPAGRTVQPATGRTAATANCYDSSTAAVTPADVPAVLYLPAESVAGRPMTTPETSIEHPNCPDPTSNAAWYAIDGDRVTRTLTVSGPNVEDPYTGSGPTTEMDGSAPRTIDVHGSPGTFYYSTPAHRGKLFWQAADGSRWRVVVGGMNWAQTLAAIRSVVIHGTEVDASRAPDGVPVAVRGATEPPPAGRFPGLSTSYVKDGQDDNGGWSLGVGQYGNLPIGPAVGSRKVDVNGRTGWWEYTGISDWDHKPTGNLTWSLPNGVNAGVMGTLNKSKALRIARATVKVSPDDPRLAGTAASTRTP